MLRIQTALLQDHSEIGLLDGTLDGCIYYTEEQARDILERLKQQQFQGHIGKRRKRKIIDFEEYPSNRWTKFPIKFKFVANHSKFMTFILLYIAYIAYTILM